MGSVCGGQSRSKADEQITVELREHGAQLSRQVKLLLLGAGESGKTTIFKQMKILEKNGDMDAKEREGWISSVYNNVQTQMRTVLTEGERLELVPTTEEEKAWASTVVGAGNVTWSPEIGDAIRRLWKCSFIKKIIKKSVDSFHLNDTAEYFFENIDRILQDNYIPTQEDVLRCRIRTTGIVEAQFNFQGFQFKLIDVGGQRNERRKWIHCFDDVTAVLFCAAVCEYMQVLREDETQNRLQETILLFDEVVNSHWFASTPVILFLNKVDLLQERLPLYKLSDCYPNYNGGDDYDAAIAFIKNRFLEANSQPRPIYTHCTIAIDTENIKFVFAAVRDIVIKTALQSDSFS